MSEVNRKMIKDVITGFLNEELEKELEKEVAQMKSPTEDSRNKKREKLLQDFNYSQWLGELKRSIEFMNNQTLSFATHNAKGIHSALKSDNIIAMSPLNSSAGVLGFGDIKNPKIDANSNNTGGHAGHLKIIVNFLNISLLGKRFYQWIISDDSEFYNFLNNSISENSFEYLQKLLTNEIDNPTSDERNKQLLFPISNNDYICIVPLYPSSMCNHLYHAIHDIKYSKEAKLARENRKKEEKAIRYRDILDLAYTKLGGDNAQNVSRLNNEQGGRNYLLPSMPPMISRSYSFKLSKFATTIFAKSLEYHCRYAIENFSAVIKKKNNNVDIRDDRKLAIDDMLRTVLYIAKDIQNNQPAGWSKDYQLNTSQKFWLDPHRGDLQGEEDFVLERQEKNWHLDINEQFASWLNALIKNKFPDMKHDIGDSEHIEWQREIEQMQKQYERAGKGVFL